MTISKPDWLSKNEFLKQVISHEVLALMAVILTVTLASVANIHLALNRVVNDRFKHNNEMKLLAEDVKKEIRDNAWMIFWGFSLTIFALFVKGISPENLSLVAMINAFVLWILGLYIMCMYDIYKVVFGVADIDKSDITHSDTPDVK